MSATIHDFGYQTYLIDGFDYHVPHRTGTYVVESDALTLIETGPSISVPYIKKGLHELGHSLDDVTYIIVTHIHLDHAGGAGLLLRECPNATVIVHHKGAEHLINPKRLVAGTKAVYGDQFEDLFDPVIPIGQERIETFAGGETLTIGRDRILHFYDTPGHAISHFSILDSLSNGLFSGDTLGIQYNDLKEAGIDFYLPTTSPTQFDMDQMMTSIEQMNQLQPHRIYFGHFGMTENVDEVFRQLKKRLPIFVDLARQAFEARKDYTYLAEQLITHCHKELLSLGVSKQSPSMAMLQLDTSISAMGLLHYFDRINKKTM